MRDDDCSLSASGSAARRSHWRVKAVGACVLLVVMTGVGVGAYGAGTWAVFQGQADRIKQQHYDDLQLAVVRERAVRDAVMARDAVGALPTAAGAAFTTRERDLLLQDVHAVSVNVDAAGSRPLRQPAAHQGGSLGAWHDAAEITKSRADANAVALREQRSRIAGITAATQTLDGALAHISASLRTRLPSTLAALGNASAERRAALSTAASGTHGTTPMERAEHLWNYVHAFDATAGAAR